MTENPLTTELKTFMRLVAQPVTVITTSYDSKVLGMTISSFTSVSMRPPLILVSLSKTAPSHDLLLKKGSFIVNLLGLEHDFLAERFAGLHRETDKFKDVDVTWNQRRLPVLAESMANMDCDVWKSIPAGDHTVVLGAPVSISIGKRSEPLVYFNQLFGHAVTKSAVVFPEDYIIG